MIFLLEEIFIFWEDHYQFDGALVPDDIRTARPLVLDPVKPWNNVIRADNVKFAKEQRN